MNDTARFNFLKQHFLNYYQEHAKSLNPPSSMKEREFGFLTFREKIMIRHKAFKDLESFNGALLSLTPSDVYYSTAYYERPDADMARKGWLGRTSFLMLTPTIWKHHAKKNMTRG